MMHETRPLENTDLIEQAHHITFSVEMSYLFACELPFFAGSCNTLDPTYFNKIPKEQTLFAQHGPPHTAAKQ